MVILNREFQKQKFQDFLIPVIALSCEDDPLSDLWKPTELSNENAINGDENRNPNRASTKVIQLCIILICRMEIPKKIHMMK